MIPIINRVCSCQSTYKQEQRSKQMSDGNRGLNEAEMSNLIGTCQREAQNIQGAVSDVNGVVDSTWWKGNDADQFRADWVGTQRVRVLSVANELESLASYLAIQLQNQQAVSRR
jgi:hypothetical protein